MAIEIERKFLIQSDEWKRFANEPDYFRQGYLTTNFLEWVVRIRIINEEKSFLTVKKSSSLITNYEFEFEIPLKEAEAIWSLLKHKLLKKRYSLNINNESWVIDCFIEENSPLVVAEIELDSPETEFIQPSWCQMEVTGLKKFSNAALAKQPISQWNIQELQKFNLG